MKPDEEHTTTYRSEKPTPHIECTLHTFTGEATFEVVPSPPSIYTDPIGWLYAEVVRLRERIEELEK